jgi:branched-chain amino acid transport system ATP-binding protein
MLLVRDLHISYGPVAAVRGISFDVERGELVSLLGSNGAGKSSTLRAISGLVQASSGGILFEGRDLLAEPPDKRVALGIAHVPEGRRVFSTMTVHENLLLGAYGTRGRLPQHSDLEAVLKLFPVLADRREQLAGTLSGGEQQMLAIGRALVARPRLLMMDEPTMGLAPKMIDLILQKIETIRANGTTILLVEQNAVETIRMSDRVFVLQLGRIAYGGSSTALTLETLKELYLGDETKERNQ